MAFSCQTFLISKQLKLRLDTQGRNFLINCTNLFVILCASRSLVLVIAPYYASLEVMQQEGCISPRYETRSYQFP
jgi:hypothetical protein